MKGTKGSSTIRKFTATTALAAMTVVGVGATGMTAASAQTGDAGGPAATTATTCHAQLVKLRAQWASLQYRIDALQVKRNQALRDGKPKAAAGYERQILQLQAKQAAVAAQIHTLEQQCG